MFRNITFLGMSLYDFLNIISFLALLIFNLTQLNRKKLVLSNSAQRAINYFFNKTNIKMLSSIAFWAVIEIILLSVSQFGLVAKLNREFGNLVGTDMNYFGLAFFMPLILFFVFFLISVDPLKQMDLITPAYTIALVFTKLACFCAGCCQGIECSFGLYNQNTELVEFPVQLVEVGLALLIFIFLMLIRNKVKEGTLFPIYLITYSGTRFFSEFLRHEPDIIWSLKTYHILCIVGVILGVLELIIVLKFGDKIRRFYAEYSGIKGFSLMFSEIRFKYLKIKKKIMKRDDPIIHHKKHKKKNQKKAKNRK